MLQLIVGVSLVIIAIGQISYALHNFQQRLHNQDIHVRQLMKLLTGITVLIGVFLFILGIIILIHH